MPLLPASLIEPLSVEFAALIGADQRPEFSPTHPWGRRWRIDRQAVGSLPSTRARVLTRQG